MAHCNTTTDNDFRLSRVHGAAKALGPACLALLAAALLVALAGCAMAPPASSSAERIDRLEASDTPETEVSKAAVNPIDFAALQQQNGDVYAWVYLPDTAVNLPVMQNSLVDNYYLTHDMYGEDSVTGGIYTQSMNSKDFTDPVTLIYGHTFEADHELSDEMFGTLHYLEDPAFFDSHPNFYIYLPDKILTYEIISAYEYDNRHIMNSFDFSDPAVVQEYFDSVANPDSMVKNVRAGVKLTAGKDSIVQLSTCTRPANDAARYLVTGVLVDEQPIG